MKIALDIMGGDHAPAEIVAGAEKAVVDGVLAPDDLLFVGDRQRIEDEFAAQGVAHRFEIAHASEVIGMDEHPAQALRRKRDSSIVVGAKLLRERKVDAFVSAGNTGAMVGASTLLVGLLPGVRRPGIAVVFATAGGPCLLTDCGANLHCQPEDLYTYGVMGSLYMSGVLGRASPKIGLLNIGEEEEKGNPLVLQTRELFAKSTWNFIGNVEGQDVFGGKCDVIVCEGFVGNVVLKVSEGLGQFVTNLFADEVRRHAADADGGVWKKVARTVLAKTDYAEYGGAPLLGVDGLAIICHGRSDRRAIANALRASRQFIEADVNRRIVAGLESGGGVPRAAAKPTPPSSSPNAPGPEDRA